MVAMLGPIIAAPLAMPVMRIVRPPMRNVAAGELVRGVGGQHAAGGGDQRRLRLAASCSAAAADARQRSCPSAGTRR